MNSIWEYIFPVSLMGIYCAVMAQKNNKNPALWFLFGFVGNIVGVVIASTLENPEKESTWKNQFE